MAKITGSEIIARCLKAEQVEQVFFVMGGPMVLTAQKLVENGIRMFDVRHEQAAALMGQAYARLKQRPGVCMAASGPGVINLTTGVANALIDCAPLIIIGGSSPIRKVGRQEFQEIDQVELMRGCTKHAERVHNLARIPAQINAAFQRAMSGKPGPVYLDFPGDILYDEIEEDSIDWTPAGRPVLRARPQGDPVLVDALVDALAKAKRPVIVSGSGVIWSRAWAEMQEFVEAAGVPFYTTPQGRGVVPDDHPLSFLTMRSHAFREADLILILGTRVNYILNHASPPRFAEGAVVARIEIDVDELTTTTRTTDIGILGDCKAVLRQILDRLGAKVDPAQFDEWREKLRLGDKKKRGQNSYKAGADIHPLRLCEEIRDFMDRDAVLVVDGQDILNFGRQSIPTFEPGHRLNSGPFGTMGVGLPFGVGAKVAKPDKQIIVLHGDGSFGMNAMELDSAVRQHVPILVIISLNGGWTADPDKSKVGRDLGYTRYDKIAEALGCYAEYVERAEDIAPALTRAKAKVDAGMVALVNVRTDFAATATTVKFSSYTT